MTNCYFSIFSIVILHLCKEYQIAVNFNHSWQSIEEFYLDNFSGSSYTRITNFEKLSDFYGQSDVWHQQNTGIVHGVAKRFESLICADTERCSI